MLHQCRRNAHEHFLTTDLRIIYTVSWEASEGCQPLAVWGEDQITPGISGISWSLFVMGPSSHLVVAKEKYQARQMRSHFCVPAPQRNWLNEEKKKGIKTVLPLTIRTATTFLERTLRTRTWGIITASPEAQQPFQGFSLPKCSVNLQ